MENYNPDLVAHVVVSHFLSSLMKIERERCGFSRKEASRNADWSSAAWGELERESRTLQPSQWITVTDVLELSSSDVVRRLNAFIGKYPNVWINRDSQGELKLLERSITSPRAIRSGNTFTVDLNQIRPNLYYELSSFSKTPDEIIEKATELEFFTTRVFAPPRSDLSREARVSQANEAKREQVIELIREMSDEKFGLLERVVDKFQRFNSKELAQAYKHFSLSVTNK